MCPAYVAGLIGLGDRKSIQPMAARTGEVGYDRPHHFIGAGLWDSAPLEATLWGQADALVGGDKAWLIIDDIALPKKGTASVGVAPQYASALGKNANCQTLASREVPITLGLRLFLPESWTNDEARMVKADVQLVFPVAGRRALMTMIGYAFLQSRRLAQPGREKNRRTAAAAGPPGNPAGLP